MSWGSPNYVGVVYRILHISTGKFFGKRNRLTSSKLSEHGDIYWSIEAAKLALTSTFSVWDRPVDPELVSSTLEDFVIIEYQLDEFAEISLKSVGIEKI